jgi:hypothetical protein
LCQHDVSRLDPSLDHQRAPRRGKQLITNAGMALHGQTFSLNGFDSFGFEERNGPDEIGWTVKSAGLGVFSYFYQAALS